MFYATICALVGFIGYIIIYIESLLLYNYLNDIMRNNMNLSKRDKLLCLRIHIWSLHIN